MSDWLIMLKTVIFPEFINTIFITVGTLILSIPLGLATGISLTITSEDGISSNYYLNLLLNKANNFLRSIPILILIILFIPFTRVVFGKAYGVLAAVLPLSAAAGAFFARLVEVNLREIKPGLIELGKALGLSKTQIVWEILMKESLPGISGSVTTCVISIIASSTVAGAVGAGGLGAIALSYGYQSFNYSILYTVVFIIVVMVQCVQYFGDKIRNFL